jgi:hypothetical protein
MGHLLFGGRFGEGRRIWIAISMIACWRWIQSQWASEREFLESRGMKAG